MQKQVSGTGRSQDLTVARRLTVRKWASGCDSYVTPAFQIKARFFVPCPQQLEPKNLMVLSKRKRDGEFVIWTPSSQASTSNQAAVVHGQTTATEPSTPPPAKKTRVNPPRSTRSATASATAEALPPPPKPAPKAKKPRAPRGKKAQAPAAQALAPESTIPPPATSDTPQPGPSSSQLPPTAPARKARKGKQKADPNAEPSGSQPEKRQAQFKPRCPQNILDRVQRVMTQRFVFLLVVMVDNFVRLTFTMLGFS